jgi:hypothetical protein
MVDFIIETLFINGLLFFRFSSIWLNINGLEELIFFILLKFIKAICGFILVIDGTDGKKIFFKYL